jgi:hypothetical protein
MEISPEIRLELARGSRDLYRGFGRDANCTGVAFGLRRRGGRVTDEPVIVANVFKKRPEGYVARGRLLPRTMRVGGRTYGVDVVETGHIYAQATSLTGGRAGPDVLPRDARPPEPILEKMRPARQGCGIGNIEDGSIGTFGCLVRDLTDGQLCMLTTGHVIGSSRGAERGHVVVQPGEHPQKPSDAIGKVKRFVPLSKDRPNAVDAAIISIDDGVPVDNAVARNLMAPISADHPIVGLHLGGDTAGHGYVMPIGKVLKALNVLPLATNATTEWNFYPVEKVARSTGYTSSRIASFGGPYPFNFGGLVPDYYVFRDVIQVEMGFTWRGDSGAIVCKGGTGEDRVAPEVGQPVGCAVLRNVGAMYDLPLAGDEPLVDRIRDGFLSQSRVGRLLTRVIYVNADTLVARTDGVVASGGEKDAAERYYEKYRDFVATVLAAPDRPDLVVTQEHLDDMAYMVFGLQQRLTREEAAALNTLYQVFRRTLGMNRPQIIAFMNGAALYDEVRATLARVPTLEHLGPPGADD